MHAPGEAVDRRGAAWLLYAVATVLLFGVWQVLPKLPTLAVAAPLAVQGAAVPGLIAALLLTAVRRGFGAASRRGVLWAAVTGAAGAIGTLAVLRAFANGGQGSVVTPVCAMYPLVTAVGGRFLFGERLGRAQTIGLGLFVAAVVAFGAEGSSHPSSGDQTAWVAFAVLAVVMFGASGLTMKLATRGASAPAALAGWCLGFTAVTLVLAALDAPVWPSSQSFWALSSLYGLLLGLGLWTSFEAYSRGRAIVVTSITALYPAVTVMLAVALPTIGEALPARKFIAVLLALAAGMSLAVEGRNAPGPAVDPGASPVL